MQSFKRNLIFLHRRIVRNPLFSIIAVLTLALGIGANTAIFSVVNGVLLKPLPFDEPERLVGVWHKAPGLNFDRLNQSPAFHFTYREENQVFEDIGMWDNTTVSITGIEEPERLPGMRFTAGTLPILRAQAALGRIFSEEDDTPGTPQTVLLSYPYWQRKFGGDPSVLGRKLIVNGLPHDIIGIMPQDFRFLRYNPAVFLPFRFNRSELFVGNFSYQGVARLKPGVTLEQANADIDRMMTITLDSFPLPPGFTREMAEQAGLAGNLNPFKQDAVGNVGDYLWVIMGTVGLVLLIACANVANLFLVRAEGRQQELAIRTAMGASWSQLARELIFESVAFGIIGGTLGTLLAYLGIKLLLAIGPETLPRLQEIAIEPIVLLFTLALSILAGLFFGIIPVVKYAKPQIAAALKESGRTLSEGKERHMARGALVVIQITLALVLLVSSGLMIRTFQAMRNVHPGFLNPEEVLTLRISIPDADASEPEMVVRMHEQILRRMEEIPGITSVGLSSSITMDGYDSNDPIFVEEFPAPEGQIPTLRRFKWIAQNYFKTMGNPILAGRDITWDDIYNRRRVVVATENFVREYWEDPSQALGKRIRTTPSNDWSEIVGIVGNVCDDGVSQEATAVIFWPMMMENFWDIELFVQRNMAYAIRSQRIGTSTFMKEIQQAVWSLNPNLPLAAVRTLDELLEDSMARTSFTLVMLGIAASVALLLGVVGIYGVISYAVSQRTREIGVRMALGAQRGDVSSMFVRHGLILTSIGIAIGCGAAWGATSLMESILFGVRRLDFLTYGAVIVCLGVVALLASYFPARRASGVDPVEALRWE